MVYPSDLANGHNGYNSVRIFHFENLYLLSCSSYSFAIFFTNKEDTWQSGLVKFWFNDQLGWIVNRIYVKWCTVIYTMLWLKIFGNNYGLRRVCVSYYMMVKSL